MGRWPQRRAAAAVRYAVVSIALTAHDERDERLTTLLTDCITAARHVDATADTAYYRLVLDALAAIAGQLTDLADQARVNAESRREC